MMKTQLIKLADIKKSDYQREALPWTVDQVAQSIKAHGYNIAYPIVIDDDNCLVDGGHRLEAAKLCGLAEVPYILKPDGVSNLRYALQCNDDRGRGRADDVFDKAEYCYKLDESGWTGQQIADELGWSTSLVSNHKNIKDKLHPLAWSTARFTRNSVLVNGDTKSAVNQGFTIVNWSESHFRTLLSHLPHNGTRDNATMRGQLSVINWAMTTDKKVTAKNIEAEAKREAWYIKAKRYAVDNLDSKVPLVDVKQFFTNINRGNFGREDTDANMQAVVNMVAYLNEQALGVRLYHGDCFEVLPYIDDGSVSLVATDPPYNVTDNDWDKIGSDDDYIDFLANWLDAIEPKLKDNYHLFVFVSPTYQARVERLLDVKGWPIKSRIIWSHRNLSKGRDVADKFIGMWEMCFHCGTHNLNWPDDWNEERFEVQEWAAPQSNFKNDKKYHPTSKPVGLFELLVKVGSRPGDIVLDPFAGGGVTGDACKEVGQRRSVLIEKSDDYCQIIESRLGIKRIEDFAGNSKD